MRWTTFAILMLPLQACIYYDGNGGDCDGDCWGDWDDTDDWDDTGSDDTGSDDTGSDDTGDDTADDSGGDTSDTCDTDDTGTIPLALSLDPAEGGPCTTFIASLTDDNGTFDLSATVSARFFGPVDVLAMQARPDEVILSLAVAGEAVPGAVDLLVEFDDGRAAFVEDAFTVTAGLTTTEDCLCPPAL